MSRHALIPKYKTPDDPASGDPDHLISPLHTNAPANPINVFIVSKTKGSPYRKEIQECPLESGKTPLKWNGEKDFYQLLKSPTGGRQPYYPMPPKVVHPNLRLRHGNQRIELRSANALLNAERDQWKSDYQYNFTGYGKSNAMHLDDYHTKVVVEVVEDRDPRVDDELVPNSIPTFTSPRPLEGRYARLYQGRRQIAASIHHQGVSNSNLVIPDVMGHEDCLLKPNCRLQSRGKDEGYKTHLEGGGEAKAEGVWREHREYGQEEGMNGGTDREPSNREQTYLREHGLEWDKKNKEIERFHEQEKLELQYLGEHDMHALIHKINHVGNGLKCKALEQHAFQAFRDAIRMQDILGNESKEQFDTGMMLSTKSISDSGKVTNIHDRQLVGSTGQSSTCRHISPKVESPRQNHGGAIVDYVARSNPFSLSLVTASCLEAPYREYTTLKPNSSTKSILKTTEPSKTRGERKRITFPEAEEIATPEYEEVQTQRATSDLSKLSGSDPKQLPSKFVRPTDSWVTQDELSDRPALRSSSIPEQRSAPIYNSTWCWNYDYRYPAHFEPLALAPRSKTAKPQTALLDMQDNWSKADVHRRFREEFPENAPDYRDNIRLYELAEKSSDLRFTRSTPHREKRHQFYGYNSYHYHNGSPIV